MYDEKRVMLSNVIVHQIAWFPYTRERDRERERENIYYTPKILHTR